MAREDHCGMDDGEKATCLYNVCVRVLKQEGGKREKGFSEELSSMVGLVEAIVMLCIARYYNGNVGTTELGE